MIKILFFGDIIGKLGRQALVRILPSLKEEFQPDLITANVENLAHGKGVTPGTMAELQDAGVDVFTSGNHVFAKMDQAVECFDRYETLIRPANYGDDYPGPGFCRITKNGHRFLIINLGGKLFFENQFRGEIANPFFTLDTVLEQESQKDDIILVDFHAEGTSEKNAMSWHADGRIAALIGTHTHIPTADSRVLPKGTAYQTDAGMTGPMDSVIGVKIENSLGLFLERDKFRMEPAEQGPLIVNAVLITIDSTADGARATAIERIRRQLD